MKFLAFSLLATFSNMVPLLSAQATKGPNIVFILTDDQDLHMDSLAYMPLVKEHLIDRGVSYQRHYCTIALCCPSRVSLLTGKAAHNTNVTDIQPPYGGYTKFILERLNHDYLPVWLQAAGYNTYYAGKLMNGHTIDNYNKPYAAGYTSSDFLLDPGMYDYFNSTWQRNEEAPENYPGQHILDVNSEKAYGFLEDAIKADKPFFLAVAPVAPHAQVLFSLDDPNNRTISPPVPQTQYNNSFPDAKVPRTPNFNPDQVRPNFGSHTVLTWFLQSGASWIKALPMQSQANVDYNDMFYQKRLEVLQGVDAMVDGLFTRLNASGLLESTYIVYSTDNGFHIGQHRLQPGKSCAIEEDYNIPLIIRGPGVPEGQVTDIVTTHTDLAPTFLQLLGLPLRSEFDGSPIPVTASGIAAAASNKTKSEHINIEYWGLLNDRNEGAFGSQDLVNNTYKSARVIGDDYSLFYTVWCDNEHELYDMDADPYQMNNLLSASSNSSTTADQSFTISQSMSMIASTPVNSSSAAASATPSPRSTTSLTSNIPELVLRLDALLLVLKSCKADACINPWNVLHPQGNVKNLADAMNPEYDAFYASQPKVAFSECQPGYIIAAEGPQTAIPFPG